MMNYRDALSVIEEVASSRRFVVEIVPTLIEDAIGRVAAKEVFSTEDVPSFDNSAMDGFAVRSELTQGASATHPVQLSVIGCIAAGDAGGSHFLSESRVAIEIMTGAPIPTGPTESPADRFDAVVKVEDVVRSNGMISIQAPVRSGENIRRRGEDYRVGSRVLSVGTPIQPEHVMAMASLGIERVDVRRPVRIAVISTGKELVHHGEKPAAGMIRNSTAPYLLTAIPKCRAECKFFGTVADDVGKFEALIKRVCDEKYDVILTTGAVSMGKYDFVRTSLEKTGAQVLFHKTSIRPGKPILFAEFKNGPVVFGVPGNPVSTAVGLRFFIEPYLRALQGLPREAPMSALLTRDVNKPNGLRCFFKARVRCDEVDILQGQASFMVSSLLESNAWVVLPENGVMNKGNRVDVYPLYPLDYEWGVQKGVHKGVRR